MAKNIGQAIAGAIRGRVVLLAISLPVFLGTVAFRDAESMDDDNSGFKLNGYNFEGEFLVFNYFVPFPGMTKVRLYNNGLELLWRSQYVDDIMGDHKITLRSTKLSSGVTYLFEFDYKGTVVKIPVTIP